MSRRSLACTLALLLAACGRGQQASPAAPTPAAAAPAAAPRERAPAAAPVAPAPPATATAGKREAAPAAPAPAPAWRFDASDQQMQQVIQYALDTTGCRMDQPQCPGLADALRDGGDRLGGYLLDQYRSAGTSHAAAQQLLDLAAATRSPAVIEYLGDQLTHPEGAGPDGPRQAAIALRNAPEVTTMSVVIRAWDLHPDDVTLREALVDAWVQCALLVPGRKRDGVQGLRLLQNDPTLTPELRGHIAAAQVCLELGRDCPAP